MRNILNSSFVWLSILVALGALTNSAHAASVTASGYTNGFGSAPVTADWSTTSAAGGAGDPTTAGGLDALAQALTASAVSGPVGSDAANPPGISASAVWCSSAFFLQTRPTGNAATFLMCTLVNNTPGDVATVNISYDFAKVAQAVEEIPGQRAYYSLSGAAGSWTPIAPFSSATPGRLTASLNIAWPVGTPLYILWGDDNDSPSPDTACQIDNFSVTTVSAAQVPAMITTSPQSQTVGELQPASFTVGVSGNPLPAIQWYTNNVAIPGATNASYDIASVPLSYNGLQFKAVAQNVASNVSYSVTSTVATLTVNADSVRPVLLGAVSSGLIQVVASFSERLAPASIANVANYSIVGPTTLTISNAVLDASQTNLFLNVSPMSAGATYTLTINNVTDQSAAANVIANGSQVQFTAASVASADIGNASAPGSVTTVASGFNITGSGTNIFGTTDQFTFGYQQLAGNFDLKARFPSFDAADALARAGLMARETLTTTSRFAAVVTGPNVYGTFFESRTNNASLATTTGWFPANYPYTWLRLERVGNTFNGYAGFDGQNWTLLGSVTLTVPSAMYVGFAASSGSSSQTAALQVRDFGSAAGGSVVPFTTTREPLGPSSRRTGLVISEIMYHPKARTDGRQTEFIEIYNSQSIWEDMSGYRLAGDVDYTFPPGTVLQAGKFLVLAKAAGDVQSVYGISGVHQYGTTNYMTNIVGGTTNVVVIYETNVVDGVTIVRPEISNSLNNGGGSIRLLSKAGAVLLDANFGTKYPWPVEADGTGHSLVLARPSYGEGNRKAWAASDLMGGSPGAFDSVAPEPARNIVINEFLAHTDPPQEDMVELYNHGNTSVNISGFWLSDDPSTNKFRIPNGTVLAPRGFISFNQTTLGFALTANGEQIFLVNSNQNRVIDAVGFEGQENGVATGRYPDGSPYLRRLSAVTPGAANAAPLNSPIVINEIMYNPISGNSDEEFVELYNRSGSAVNVGNWKFVDGIDFRFQPNTMISAGGYLVVAKNVSRLRANYSNLGSSNVVGDYSGSLNNGGERIALAAPDYDVVTNGNGQLFTNVAFHYVVNEVSYGTGGRWGNWSDGGGSSLELIDPRSDNTLAANWADSDETAKSSWTSFEATGSVDDEWTQTHDNIHVYVLGVGECLVDDIEVRPQPGNQNIMINGSFENGFVNWVPQGSHDQSFLESVGFTGSRSLHLMGGSRGDPGANKVRSVTGNSFTATFPLGSVVTLRAKARWLRGFPEVLLRLHGGGMEAPGRLPVPKNLGTPGAQNSQFRANGAPAVYDVVHSPVLPAINEPVVVTARVSDPDGLSSLVLRYRVDPSQTLNSVPLLDNGTGGDAVAGDGLFSATIPGQTASNMIAFHVQAVDNAVSRATNLFPAAALSRQFPNDSPKHECLVRWGEVQMPGSYATYHIWITDETNTRWTTRARLSNAGLDATFAYNNFRVVYNMRPQYAGSVWHVGQMDGPATGPGGDRTDYVLNFPEDDLMLGQTDFVLNTVGNPSGATSTDGSAQSEQTSYIIFREMGVHYNYRRYIHVFVNGDRRSVNGGVPFIMEDSQQPNGDVVKEWFPNDSEGQLYKIEDRFEYNDAGDAHGGEGNAQLVRVNSLYNGASQLKLAHYRFMFRKRSLAAWDSASDYTNLFAVVDIVSPTNNPNITPLTDPIVKQLHQVVDLEQWMRIFAVQHTIGNWDSYGYRRGKNAYTYRPNFGKFAQMTWDIDFTMGVGGDGTTQGLFSDTAGKEPRIDAMYLTPEIRRMSWRAFQDIVNGPLNNSYLDPILDAKAAAHAANGVQYQPGVVSTIKSYISGRRTYILSQIPTATFSITSATNFTSPTNIVTLTGIAPIDVKYFEINGISYSVNWTTQTNWSLRVPMEVTGSNFFVLQGLDRFSNAIPSTVRTVAVNYTGPIELPQTNIVFNEIMYNPLVAGSEFVELYNRSATFTFDLSGWRINGLDYTFPEGATIGPRSFLVLTKDRVSYANAYGGLAPAFDQFPGELQLNGETLTLIKPGATPAQDVIVDRVRYDGALPWPEAASGTGSSYQLLDPNQDNSRVGNWFSIYTPPVYCCEVSEPARTNGGWRFVSVTGSAANGIGGGQMRLMIYIGTNTADIGSAIIDDVSLVPGTTPGVGQNFIRNGDFESQPLIEDPPLTNSWNVGTNYTNTVISSSLVHSGNGALRLVAGSFGNSFPRIISQLLSPAPLANSTNTLSFWYWATNSATNLNVRLQNSGQLNVSTNINIFIIPSNYIPPQVVSYATNTLSPGATNQMLTSLPPFPTLWINELQADNVNGIPDNASQRDPWIELFNNGTSAVSLDGLYLANNYTNLTQWAFPAGYTIAPGQFLVVFCDAQTGQTTAAQPHTSFRLASGSGSIALSRLYNGEPQVIDYINYAAVHSDRSYGSFPDGQPFDRQEFFYVTPGALNDGRSAPLNVFINEWMASNTNYVADPADLDYDDWFELYNPSTNAVDIAGYYLTDTNGNKTKYLITTNGPHVIPAEGYLLVWADNETGQNMSGGVPRQDLHVNFQLSGSGEQIGMYAADGTEIDLINFGSQTGNVSQGRFPNGGSSIYFMTNPTPRSANYVPGQGNLPPTLNPIGSRSVYVGQTLSFTATATDPDPGQVLGFTIVGPPGATIDLNTGLFSWTPPAVGTNVITIRVSDNGSPMRDDSENVVVRVLSLPNLAVPSISGNELSLTWSAVGGRQYRVQYKNDLNDANWTDLGQILTVESDGVLSITDDITARPHRFYQLIIVQ